MPYTVRKQKCKQSDGDSGSYVLSYTDKKGKKHRNCHTSRKKARGQIAAIEAEGAERNSTMKIKLSELKQLIREAITSLMSPEGKEAAFLSAPTKKDGVLFLSKDKLEDHIFAIPGGYDDAVLYNTLEDMLSRDDKLSPKSPLKLDPEFRKDIEEEVAQWHMNVDPGRGESPEDERFLKTLIRGTLSRLYKPEVEEPSKYIAGYKKPAASVGQQSQMPASKLSPKFLESIDINDLKEMIKEAIEETKRQSTPSRSDADEAVEEGDVDESEFTYAIAKAADQGKKQVDIDGKKFPVKMSKDKAEDIVDKKKK